ncbi:MAG: spermidine synthase [Planctomycetaceae bacterium]|nr:spermidine synthase [Planctomycetaceae bacterium]
MNFKILAYEDTPLGLLCLRRREILSQPGKFVTEVTLNHEFLMSSYLTASEKALSELGLERVQSAGTDGKLRVLVGGLGLGYTAASALDSVSVNQVEVVEFLPQVIAWLEDGLVPLAERLNADDRMSVTHGDIYERLSRSGNQEFDLIAIDVDHSPEDVLGEQSQGFYSCEGLERAKSHLAPGGVLGVWSYDESSPLLANMQEVFETVTVEKVTVMNDLIREEQTDWLFFGVK